MFGNSWSSVFLFWAFKKLELACPHFVVLVCGWNESFFNSLMLIRLFSFDFMENSGVFSYSGVIIVKLWECKFSSIVSLFAFAEPLMYYLICYRRFSCLLTYSPFISQFFMCARELMSMPMTDYYCLNFTWLRYRRWRCRPRQGRDWWGILKDCNKILLLASVGLPKTIILCFGMLLSLGV